MKKLLLSLAFATVCVAPAFATTAQPATKPTEPKKEATQEEKAATVKPSLVLVASTCDMPAKDATATEKAAPEKTPVKPAAPKLAFA